MTTQKYIFKNKKITSLSVLRLFVSQNIKIKAVARI